MIEGLDEMDAPINCLMPHKTNHHNNNQQIYGHKE